jgi:hypothetical protein
MGWTLRGSNLGEGRDFSAPVQTIPGAHPAYCTMGTGSLPGVQRPKRGVDHSPPSSAEIKERVDHLQSPSGPSRPVLGQFTFVNIRIPNFGVDDENLIQFDTDIQ